jgi:hypothetical protein
MPCSLARAVFKTSRGDTRGISFRYKLAILNTIVALGLVRLAFDGREVALAYGDRCLVELSVEGPRALTVASKYVAGAKAKAGCRWRANRIAGGIR